MTKILITGAMGFIGKNLTAQLNNMGYKELFLYDKDKTIDDLAKYTENCDFVFHLAGINRPEKEEEFFEGNCEFTEILLKKLRDNKKNPPVLLSSSIQAALDNPYGKSKKIQEKLIFKHSEKSSSKAYLYRLPNLFGKWSRPNYNTVVATFCHNIARGIQIKINDPASKMTLCYIDDVVNEFIRAMKDNPSFDGRFCSVNPQYETTVGELADTLNSFRDFRTDLFCPDLGNELTKKLYSTYLSFLPEDDFSYELDTKFDSRGSFTEFFKTNGRGQVSVNISKPGIVKGNHWHHTKNEKFLVVSGTGIIRFRKIDSEKIFEYPVSGTKLEVVDIPVGYTHNIENTGKTDMVTVMWANECFDPENPDTFYLEV